MRLCALFLALILGGCASGYKEFFQRAGWATPEAIAARRAVPPPAMPIVERARPGIGNTYAAETRWP
jgi:hypothetical protein